MRDRHSWFCAEVTVSKLKPTWPKRQRALGERMRQAWEEFFAAAKSSDPTAARLPAEFAEQQRIAAVQARHETALLRYPNVVGVATGIRMKRGKPTGEPCLVVYVQRKVPRTKLRKSKLLPSEIAGVSIDVVEVGKLEALPTDLPG
jgi:hypothetical protein